MSVHLDGSLMISEDAIGNVCRRSETSHGISARAHPQRCRLRHSRFTRSPGARRVTAAFFEQDLLTGDVVGFPVNDKVDGEEVMSAKMLSDGTTPTAAERNPRGR